VVKDVVESLVRGELLDINLFPQAFAPNPVEMLRTILQVLVADRLRHNELLPRIF
jgi:hypothetical protein